MTSEERERRDAELIAATKLGVISALFETKEVPPELKETVINLVIDARPDRWEEASGDPAR